MTYAKNLLASAAVLLVSSSAHAEVVINELLHVSGGATDFVELYNNGDEAVDIGGWTLHAGTTLTAINAVDETVPAGTSLAAGGYWVFARDFAAADAGGDAGAAGGQALGSALPAASSTADCVQIRDGGTIIDTVLFGTPPNPIPDAEKWTDDASDGGVSASYAPEWDSGRSLGRRPNGVDTNASGTDFILTPAGQNTPGAANYEAPPVPDAGSSSSSSSSSSGSSGQSSSSGGRSSSSSSGGRSSSSGSRSDGGMNSEGDDDDDNSNLAADDGGCSMGAATGAPMPFLIGLGALLVIRRRRLARKP